LTAYLDTSFLVSLYAPDSNSPIAAARMGRIALPTLITPLTELELVNALSLRVFHQDLRPAEVKAARAAFYKDLESGVFVSQLLPGAAYLHANRMARRRTPRLGTRTLDVLHVAAAVALKAGMFLSFDNRQNALARVEGLTVL